MTEIQGLLVTTGIPDGVILRFLQHSITFHRCYSARYMGSGRGCHSESVRNRPLDETGFDVDLNPKVDRRQETGRLMRRSRARGRFGLDRLKPMDRDQVSTEHLIAFCQLDAHQSLKWREFLLASTHPIQNAI